MFRCINKDLSTLNHCVNHCQEREKTLALEVQKYRDQQWKLIHHLEVLEQREQDREIRIALQEDQIQMLQRDVDKLQGKISLGARGPGTCDYILRTLRGLVKLTCILITNNIWSTFGILSAHGIHMESPTPGQEHLKCTLQFSLNVISPTTNPHISVPAQNFPPHTPA